MNITFSKNLKIEVHTVLGIEVREEPLLVRKAFLNVVEKHTPSGNSVLKERG
jgi:hypothetical protein